MLWKHGIMLLYFSKESFNEKSEQRRFSHAASYLRHNPGSHDDHLSDYNILYDWKCVVSMDYGTAVYFLLAGIIGSEYHTHLKNRIEDIPAMFVMVLIYTGVFSVYLLLKGVI